MSIPASGYRGVVRTSGALITNGSVLNEVQYSFVNAGAAGNTEVVAAQAGYSIVVLCALIISTAAQSVGFQSNVTAISASFPLAANGGFALPLSEHGWFETNVGEALNINLGSATATGIQVVWVLK